MPIDNVAAAVPQLPQAADRLHPPERLLDQLAPLLTDQVAVVTSRSLINRALLLQSLSRPFRRTASSLDELCRRSFIDFCVVLSMLRLYPAALFANRSFGITQVHEEVCDES